MTTPDPPAGRYQHYNFRFARVWGGFREWRR
jgi:hypothetical protein